MQMMTIALTEVCFVKVEKRLQICVWFPADCVAVLLGFSHTGYNVMCMYTPNIYTEENRRKIDAPDL